MTATAASRGTRGIVRSVSAITFFDYAGDFAFLVTGMLFFVAKGLSASAIFTTVSVVWLVEALFEVPTGVVADIVGRAQSVRISFALRVIAYLVMFAGWNVQSIVLAHVIMAIGTTFYSGAMDAWAVDSYEREGGEDLEAMFSTVKQASSAGHIVGAVSGALLGYISLAIPFALAASLCGLGMILSLILMRGHDNQALADRAAEREANGEDDEDDEPTSLRESVREVLHGTAETFRHGARLNLLVGVVVVVGFLLTIPGVQWSVYLAKDLKGTLILLAAAATAGSLIQMPLLRFVAGYRVRGVISRRQLVTAASLLAGGFLTLSARVHSFPVAIAAYACFTATIGLVGPSVRAAVNELIPSQYRATALSATSLVDGLVSGSGLLIIGVLIHDVGDVSLTWPLTGVALALVGIGLGLAVGADPAPAGAEEEEILEDGEDDAEHATEGSEP